MVPAGFVTRLMILLMGKFAQSAFSLAAKASVALRSGIPDSAALMTLQHSSLVPGALLAAQAACRLLKVSARISRETVKFKILVICILKNILK